MHDFLVFQLYGPMASWGDIAVGEIRVSAAHPGKSAILGLLAAALGIDRQDEAAHAAMARAFGFGCKVISAGTLLVDYHTVQVPPQQRKTKWPTRKAELSSGNLGTLLSSREYRCDAAYTVAMWEAAVPAPFTLAQMADALLRPIYTPYLGRKSCPPALPMQPRVMQSCTLKQALDSRSAFESELNLMSKRSSTWLYYWEDLEDSDLGIEQRFERWDVPLSRKRWQFSPRSENLFVQNREE